MGTNATVIASRTSRVSSHSLLMQTTFPALNVMQPARTRIAPRESTEMALVLGEVTATLVKVSALAILSRVFFAASSDLLY